MAYKAFDFALGDSEGPQYCSGGVIPSGDWLMHWQLACAPGFYQPATHYGIRIWFASLYEPQVPAQTWVSASGVHCYEDVFDAWTLFKGPGEIRIGHGANQDRTTTYPTGDDYLVRFYSRMWRYSPSMSIPPLTPECQRQVYADVAPGASADFVTRSPIDVYRRWPWTHFRATWRWGAGLVAGDEATISRASGQSQSNNIIGRIGVQQGLDSTGTDLIHFPAGAARAGGDSIILRNDAVVALMTGAEITAYRFRE